jgi:hypothetical protein
MKNISDLADEIMKMTRGTENAGDSGSKVGLRVGSNVYQVKGVAYDEKTNTILIEGQPK